MKSRPSSVSMWVLTWSHDGDVAVAVVGSIERAAESMERVFDGLYHVLRGPVQAVVVWRLAVFPGKMPIRRPTQTLKWSE